MWFVYFLKTDRKENWYYVGSTNNLERRLDEHNAGEVTSTKAYMPYTIIYIEEFKTEPEAREREKYFKRWDGRIEKKKIISHSGIV